ncbi:MAG: hypothetical protein E7288_08730 [Lachnospiraceae bacterium]|nr:hypothetical protein [Lachnospiraceae bacterium]
MNILLYDIGSYTQSDFIYFLRKSGHNCKNLLYKCTNLYHDDFFEYKFNKELSALLYDCVISTNFSPIVAKLCYKHKLKYISWIYDSPINTEQIKYFQFPTNHIFHFDRIQVEQIKSLGNINIYHLPLAVNTERLNKILITQKDISAYTCDISFIGQFYNTPLAQIMSVQTDYDKGYINAILDSQLKIYGYNFIEELITDELINRFNQRLHSISNVSEELSKQGLIYNIAKQITHTERLALLTLLGQLFQVHYYATETPPVLSHLKHQGSAKYFTEMPKIFRLSKLNLNPTLKSIQSGIPLRALDILGSKGVLLSNFQPELAEYFTDGVDVIMYDSIESALDKADFYLKNDAIRQQIALNGYNNVATNFAYPEKINYIFKTAGLS